MEQTDYQLLLASFDATFTETDKTKRQAAILFIKQHQTNPQFLTSLFTILSTYPVQLNCKPQTIQAIINWVDKFVAQQHRPNIKQTVMSRIDLLNIVQKGISQLSAGQFPHKFLVQLCKPLSTILNHQNNETLKLQLIQKFRDKFISNPRIVFYELLSILTSKQHQIILNRIIPYIRDLMSSIEKAGLDEITFYLEVVLVFLNQIEPSMSALLFKEICNNVNFMTIIYREVKSGKNQQAQVPIKILILLNKLKIKLQTKDTPSLNRINVDLFPMIFQFLSAISGFDSDKLKQYREGNNLLIMTMIKYFTSLVEIAKDQQIFHSKKIEILLNIIFPFLVIPEDQSLNLLEESPHQYLLLKEDIIIDHKIQHTSSAAAQLLQIYSDKVNGVTTIAIEIVLNIIKNCISQQNQIKKQYISTVFFKTSQPQKRLEIALNVFSILSYQIQLRSEVIEEMQELIQKYMSVLFDPWKTETSIQFLLMLSYYIDNLFESESKQYMRPFVVDSILTAASIHPARALLLSIYDYLENIFVYPEYGMIIRSKASKIGQILISHVSTYQDVDSLSLLKKLFKEQSSNIIANHKQQFIWWMNQLNIKLKEFIEKGQFNQFVVKGLDVLDSLILNDDFEELIDMVYSSVEPYMLAFKNPESPLFDEILTVVNRYIQIKKIIPQGVSILLQNIQPIIQKNQSNIYNLFRTFCYILIYSSTEAQIHRIYQLGLTNLKDTTTKIRSLLNPLEGILIVHLSLFYHITKFSSEALKQLIYETIKILNYQYIKHHRPMYAKYILIILQSLRLRFQETTSVLLELQMQDRFYQVMFESKVYFDGYDRKVFILNMIELIYNKNFDGKYAFNSLKTIIEVLFAHYSAIQLQFAQKYEDSDSSEDDNPDEAKELDVTLSQNSRQMFKLYPNPYKGLDQYLSFRTLISKIKTHPDSFKLFQSVMNQMPIGIQNFVKEYALVVHKIQVQENKFEKRKLFKVKRK